ncbi:hypothetical protein [Paenibacillus turpanensis]|uniref:hypothetical protein n=1 Tax=Paenibacillus turpanensis TaxID=2689078 RepID=UPI0014090C9E|nr:hypothetical protein [Paenibacillus turpanensis]
MFARAGAGGGARVFARAGAGGGAGVARAGAGGGAGVCAGRSWRRRRCWCGPELAAARVFARAGATFAPAR